MSYKNDFSVHLSEKITSVFDLRGYKSYFDVKTKLLCYLDQLTCFVAVFQAEFS